MADVHTKEQRSYNMSRIRNKDTKPEMVVRKFLFSKGFRYRLHAKNLPGKPDIVLPKYKTVVFINGCFWHGHEACKFYVVPKTRTDWWLSKINNNKEKDQKVIQVFKAKGWQIITVWECQLKKEAKEITLNNLAEMIFSCSLK